MALIAEVSLSLHLVIRPAHHNIKGLLTNFDSLALLLAVLIQTDCFPSKYALSQIGDGRNSTLSDTH